MHLTALQCCMKDRGDVSVSCRAIISESLKAVTQQLHEAESQNKHLIELETDLQRREDMFESQVTSQLPSLLHQCDWQNMGSVTAAHATQP